MEDFDNLFDPNNGDAEDAFLAEFWPQVEALAEELGVSTRYIEEEFIIEGELIENAKDLK